MSESSSNEWFFETKRCKSILSPGVYKGTLKGVFPGKRKAFDGTGEKPTLTFSFQTVKEGAVINRTVNSSMSEKSGCVKLVDSMACGQIPNSAFDDGAKLKEFIEGLIGKDFLLQIEPSKNGKFNDLKNIFPVPKHD